MPEKLPWSIRTSAISYRGRNLSAELVKLSGIGTAAFGAGVFPTLDHRWRQPISYHSARADGKTKILHSEAVA